MSISDKKTIKIFDNEYEVVLTNGSLIDIEKVKIQLSGGTHTAMGNSNTMASDRAYLTVEAIATFTILIPQLKKDLLVSSLLDLPLLRTKVLIKAYIEQFFPWFKTYLEEVNRDEDSEKK